MSFYVSLNLAFEENMSHNIQLTLEQTEFTLGSNHEISKYTTAVTRKWAVNSKIGMVFFVRSLLIY
jgi:hypothetical protein